MWSSAGAASGPRSAARSSSTRVHARYVWEWPFYPQYYIPWADVDQECGRRRGSTPRPTIGERCGSSAWRSATLVRPSAVRVYGDSRHGGAQRHGPLRMVRPRPLVRGGRRDLRAPAQSLRPGGCAALDASGAGRARRGRPGGVVVSGDGVRDGPPDPVLPQSQRGRFLAPGAVRHRHLVSLQGHDDRVLVVPAGRHRAGGHGLDLRLPRRANCCRSPAWWRSTTRRSTPSWTGSCCPVLRRTSPEAGIENSACDGGVALRAAACEIENDPCKSPRDGGTLSPRRPKGWNAWGEGGRTCRPDVVWAGTVCRHGAWPPLLRPSPLVVRC